MPTWWTGCRPSTDAAALAGTYFGQDVIREFQVITSGAPAIFGRAASGVVNIVTQSGGQARHGRLRLRLRPRRLARRTSTRLRPREDPLSQWQYRRQPVGADNRDRAFYFANVNTPTSSAPVL